MYWKVSCWYYPYSRGQIEDCMTTKHTGFEHKDAVCIYRWSFTVWLIHEKDQHPSTLTYIQPTPVDHAISFIYSVRSWTSISAFFVHLTRTDDTGLHDQRPSI